MDPLVIALMKIAYDIQDAQKIAREALELLGIDVDDPPKEVIQAMRDETNKEMDNAREK